MPIRRRFDVSQSKVSRWSIYHTFRYEIDAIFMTLSNTFRTRHALLASYRGISENFEEKHKHPIDADSRSKRRPCMNRNLGQNALIKNDRHPLKRVLLQLHSRKCSACSDLDLVIVGTRHSDIGTFFTTHIIYPDISLFVIVICLCK